VETILLVILVIVAVAMIGAVLIQRSEGGALGIGGGGPGAMFSARGSANFLTRLTAGLAAVFMILSLVLAILGRDNGESGSVVDIAPETTLDSDALQPFDSEDYDPDALDTGAPTGDSAPANPESAQQTPPSNDPAVPSPD
jgi:preprotein translocase subunit SecG